MNLKVMLDRGAKMPTVAHENDVGYDLYSPVDVLIYNDDSVDIDTGVHIMLPPGYAGLIKSKSGLSRWYSTQCDGVIDPDYTGSIHVKLYNHGRCAVSIAKNQKIAQLLIVPCIKPELLLVDEFPQTERGDGGFGSTGKF